MDYLMPNINPFMLNNLLCNRFWILNILYKLNNKAISNLLQYKYIFRPACFLFKTLWLSRKLHCCSWRTALRMRTCWVPVPLLPLLLCQLFEEKNRGVLKLAEIINSSLDNSNNYCCFFFWLPWSLSSFVEFSHYM